jgi:hypothetical protein
MKTLRKIGESGITQNSAAQYLLDTEGLTGAFAAYSLRKLRSAYTGFCMRIRRANDNAEAEIPFSGNWIDKSAVDAHCTTNDGFVVSFYDQSGNGYNIPQFTANLQYKIWNGSTRDWVATINNRPITAPLANNGNYVRFNIIPIETTAMSICCVSGCFGASAPTTVLRTVYANGGSVSGVYFPNLGYDPEVFDATPVITNFVTGVAPTTNTSYVTGWSATGGSPATTRVRFNGVTHLSTDVVYTPTGALGSLLIGGTGRFTSANHSFQEAIWWLRDIGDVGLTLYAGNCLSSSQYGSTGYV